MALFKVMTQSGDERNVVASSDGMAILKIQQRYGAVAIGVECINAHRIHAKTAMSSADVTLDCLAYAGSVPACCDEGCEVEPDGECEHGCPSVLMALGIV